MVSSRLLDIQNASFGNYYSVTTVAVSLFLRKTKKLLQFPETGVRGRIVFAWFENAIDFSC